MQKIKQYCSRIFDWRLWPQEKRKQFLLNLVWGIMIIVILQVSSCFQTGQQALNSSYDFLVKRDFRRAVIDGKESEPVSDDIRIVEFDEATYMAKTHGYWTPRKLLGETILKSIELGAKVVVVDFGLNRAAPECNFAGVLDDENREYLSMLEKAADLAEKNEAVILKASDDSLQLRENASKSNVIKMNEQGKLDDYRYVIFSCHGLLPLETNQLMQPALALSHPDPVTGEDGFLTMADVFGIRLNADLVTLSACNTGRGQLQKGEGVIGLTRAFMYAGTPAVSVTLWSVESESAKVLSTGLYKNLKEGMSRAEALRQIKVQMIREEKGEFYKHPFFWAPLVLFGVGS